jgi:hypothetical protein
VCKLTLKLTLKEMQTHFDSIQENAEKRSEVFSQNFQKLMFQLKVFPKVLKSYLYKFKNFYCILNSFN